MNIETYLENQLQKFSIIDYILVPHPLNNRTTQLRKKTTSLPQN